MTDLRIQNSGFNQIIEYFGAPSHHLDDDWNHISKEELKNAVGKISPQADAVVNAIVNSEDGYAHLRAIQDEGWFNDSEVSMRDLYAARRGTGYEGEEIRDEVEMLQQSLPVYSGFEVQCDYKFPETSTTICPTICMSTIIFHGPPVVRSAILFETDPEYIYVEKAVHELDSYRSSTIPWSGDQYIVTKIIITAMLCAHLEKKAELLEGLSFAVPYNAEPYNSVDYYYEAKLAAKAYRDLIKRANSWIELPFPPFNIITDEMPSESPKALFEKAFDEEKAFVNQGDVSQVLQFLSAQGLETILESYVTKPKTVVDFFGSFGENIIIGALEEVLNQANYQIIKEAVKKEVKKVVGEYREKYLRQIPAIPYSCVCENESTVDKQIVQSFERRLTRLDEIYNHGESGSIIKISPSGSNLVYNLFDLTEDPCKVLENKGKTLETTTDNYCEGEIVYFVQYFKKNQSFYKLLNVRTGKVTVYPKDALPSEYSSMSCGPDNFLVGDGRNLFLVDIDGKNRRTIWTSSGDERRFLSLGKEGGCACSLNGQQVVFPTVESGFKNAALWIMNNDGSDRRKLASIEAAPEDYGGLQFSPNGNFISYHIAPHFYIWAITGEQVAKLPGVPSRHYWSPEENTLYYVESNLVPGLSDSFQRDGDNIVSFDIGGKKKKNIISKDTPPQGVPKFKPSQTAKFQFFALSRDHKHIVYAFDYQGDSFAVVDIDGKNNNIIWPPQNQSSFNSQLYEVRIFNVEWCDNNSGVVVEAFYQKNSMHLLFIPINGSPPIDITPFELSDVTIGSWGFRSRGLR